MTIVHLDCETISEANLTRIGAFEYAAHPSTRMIICCYAFDGGQVHTWLPETEPFPDDLFNHMDERKPCLAWNAQFEKAIFCNFAPDKKINWQCTMALAAYYGYPLSLDKAAEAMKLPFGKDKVGHALMKRMCRPRDVPNTGAPVWWHVTNQEKFKRLQAYCRTDVQLERLIHTRLEADRLPDPEQRVWNADQSMNERGVCLDRDLVTALTAIVDTEQIRLDLAMDAVTHGEVTRCSQVGKLQKWVTKQWSPIESLDKEHLAGYLKQPLPLDVDEALRLRQEAAKSSTAKLKAMTNCASDKDNRMRGMIQYYGANRTGRFAGRLAQPHNYPRPEIKDPENAIAYIKAGMTVEGIRMFWGSPMSVVSSCLRGCFIPAKNHTFLSVDFSQIEARVLAWLVSQTDILDLFAKGEDVYTYAAKGIGSEDRQLGKVLTLACGFGMGPDKFQETAAKYGVDLGAGQARLAVERWRNNNPHVVNGWRRLERVCNTITTDHIDNAITAFNSKLRVMRKDGTLVIRLPSGRELFYRESAMVPGRFNNVQLSYMGLNGYTRKWERIETYGGKLIENVVQAIARDILTWALVELDKLNDKICLTVHDELLLEIPNDFDLKQVTRITLNLITKGPDWAHGLPLAASSWTGDRYRK